MQALMGHIIRISDPAHVLLFAGSMFKKVILEILDALPHYEHPGPLIHPIGTLHGIDQFLSDPKKVLMILVNLRNAHGVVLAPTHFHNSASRSFLPSAQIPGPQGMPEPALPYPKVWSPLPSFFDFTQNLTLILY